MSNQQLEDFAQRGLAAQQAADRAIRDSHHPDLTERLIEAHRTLQMSREYLYSLYPRGHRAADEINDAMVALQTAIEAL